MDTSYNLIAEAFNINIPLSTAFGLKISHSKAFNIKICCNYGIQYKDIL